jgi:3-(3-hydroxy-phenyl)propionate hydroxylase
VLINFGKPRAFASRAGVPVVDAQYAGPWELPVVGTVSPPQAVLVRPDGYVAWVGEGTQAGLSEALSVWFGEG